MGYVGTSFLLQLVGTDSKTVGFQRDCRFLGFWVSKRGESALLAHDFAVQSLVCYTFCDRGWLKGVARWRSKHFEVAAGQADFESFRFRNSGFAYTKSGCTGVGDAAYFFCITGGARGISHSRTAAATHLVLSFIRSQLAQNWLCICRRRTIRSRLPRCKFSCSTCTSGEDFLRQPA